MHVADLSNSDWSMYAYTYIQLDYGRHMHWREYALPYGLRVYDIWDAGCINEKLRINCSFQWNRLIQNKKMKKNVKYLPCNEITGIPSFGIILLYRSRLHSSQWILYKFKRILSEIHRKMKTQQWNLWKRFGKKESRNELNTHDMIKKEKWTQNTTRMIFSIEIFLLATFKQWLMINWNIKYFRLKTVLDWRFLIIRCIYYNFWVFCLEFKPHFMTYLHTQVGTDIGLKNRLLLCLNYTPLSLIAYSYCTCFQCF